MTVRRSAPEVLDSAKTLGILFAEHSSDINAVHNSDVTAIYILHNEINAERTGS